jgi:hypothetical protein
LDPADRGNQDTPTNAGAILTAFVNKYHKNANPDSTWR